MKSQKGEIKEHIRLGICTWNYLFPTCKRYSCLRNYFKKMPRQKDKTKANVYSILSYVVTNVQLNFWLSGS